MSTSQFRMGKNVTWTDCVRTSEMKTESSDFPDTNEPEDMSQYSMSRVYIL